MKIKILFLTLLSSFVSPLNIKGNAAIAAPPHMSVGQGGLIPQPTEEEMRYIMEEFLPSLSDEELEELAKIGQEIMETAEKEGIPLWQPPAPAKSNQKQPERVPATTAHKEVKKEKETTKKAAPTAAKKRIKDLIAAIESIRQKASSDQELEDTFSALDDKINSLLYYLHVLNDDKLINYLLEEESSSLNSLLKELRYDLEVLDNKFIVPAQKVHETKKEDLKHKDALKKAAYTLEDIIKRFQKAFKQEAILVQIEKLLKKYEPEALKTKKEIDAAEKKAEQFIKTLPKTNTGRRGFAGPHGYPGGYGAPHRGPGAPRGAQQPFQRVKPGSTTSRAQTKLKDGNTSKSTPKKDTDSKKKKPSGKKTIGGLEHTIRTKLDDFEKYLSPFALRLNDFADNYAKNKKETGTLQPILQEAQFKAKLLKKDVESWASMIDKEIKTYKDVKEKKKKVKAGWQNKLAHPKLKALYEKMKDLEKKKVSLEGDFKNLYTHLKKINEKILEI